jgi:hypothetical protein
MDDRLEQVRLLRDWQAHDYSELKSAEEAVQRISDRIQKRKELIRSLEAPEPNTFGGKVASAVSAAPPGSGLFDAVMKTAGPSVERKPQFRAFRLVDAVGIVLAEKLKNSPEPDLSAMHANELVEAIFDAQNKFERFRAKNFITGVVTKDDKNHFLKVGPNRWRINPESIMKISAG